MKSINDMATEMIKNHNDILEGEIIKFIKSIRKEYSFIPAKDLGNIALNDGYTFLKTEKHIFINTDKYVSGIEYEFYAIRLNVIVAKRKRIITEHYIIGD